MASATPTLQDRIDKVFAPNRTAKCQYGPACYRKNHDHLRYKVHDHLDKAFPGFLQDRAPLNAPEILITQLSVMKKTLEIEEKKALSKKRNGAKEEDANKDDADKHDSDTDDKD